MKSASMQTIERELPRLSREEQLWLIEHVAQHLRKEQRRQEWIDSLDAMAKDPQIQAEIRQIEAEFAITEEDGLEGL